MDSAKCLFDIIDLDAPGWREGALGRRVKPVEYGIVSAYKSRTIQGYPMLNSTNLSWHDQLKIVVDSWGLDYLEQVAYYKGMPEQSLLIFDISLDDTLRLAVLHSPYQDTIIHNNVLYSTIGASGYPIKFSRVNYKLITLKQFIKMSTMKKYQNGSYIPSHGLAYWLR